VGRHSHLRTDGRVRPLWRCLLSVLMVAFAMVIAGAIVGVVAGLRHVYPGPLEALASTAFLTLPLLLLVFKLLSNMLEHQPLAAVGLAFHERWGAELVHGLALGTAMVLAVGGLERLLGAVSFSWNSAPAASLARQGLILAAVFLVAAANEELTFRGYPFQRLVDSVGPVGAVVVMSVLFGAIHLGNPEHTWFSAVNTMLIGVPFAIAYLRTRALWLPLGMHFAWNFFQGYALGLPVSGIVLAGPLAVARVHGPVWLTGGSYGPEGGLLTTVVAVAATVFLLLVPGIYTTQRMRELVYGRAVAEPDAAPPPGEDSERPQQGSD
jgi:CAAX protease family protein